MKQILLFIIIILILGIFYIYGLYLDQKKHNKNNNIYTTPEIINPTFQFSTELNNKQVNNNNIKISNVEIYDDLLINNDKYYFDRELFINFNYELPKNEYFYFSFFINVKTNTQHKIKYNKDIVLRTGEGDLNSEPLSFTILRNKKDNKEFIINRMRILVNNMKNEIVYNNIVPLDIKLNT
jgi:hypothetical protein